MHTITKTYENILKLCDKLSKLTSVINILNTMEYHSLYMHYQNKQTFTQGDQTKDKYIQTITSTIIIYQDSCLCHTLVTFTYKNLTLFNHSSMILSISNGIPSHITLTSEYMSIIKCILVQLSITFMMLHEQWVIRGSLLDDFTKKMINIFMFLSSLQD